MARILPRLRADIDVIPSPIAAEPGLLLRDPRRYTETVLVVPPVWVSVLRCLDGEHTVADAQAALTRLAGRRLVPSERVDEFVSALDEHGFLQTPRFEETKRRRQDAFRRADVREPAHAGTAYPASPEEIEAELRRHLGRGAAADVGVGTVAAIAAPHVSPAGGYATYRAAYGPASSNGDEAEPVFVVLGTSHYGEPERFGLTRKVFRTPLGDVEVDRASVSWLEERCGGAVLVEDYCHGPEHSIELQVVFLQYKLARPFRIVPVLCGPFLDSLAAGRPPESVESNRRVFDALAELADRTPGLSWVLGVDLSHVGRRYGDERAARAGQGHLLEVEQRDRARLERVAAGDAEGFFELVHPEGDDLNWCGYSPFYTFLRVMPALGRLEGTLRSYQQWNIDPGSVVSFAAMHFCRKDGSSD